MDDKEKKQEEEQANKDVARVDRETVKAAAEARYQAQKTK